MIKRLPLVVFFVIYLPSCQRLDPHPRRASVVHDVLPQVIAEPRRARRTYASECCRARSHPQCGLERAEEGDERVFLGRSQTDGEQVVVELDDVGEGRGAAVVEIRRAGDQAA